MLGGSSTIATKEEDATFPQGRKKEPNSAF